MKTIPVYSIKIPEYDVKTKPDWKKIGAKIDVVIKENFLGKKVAIRCLGSQEHKGKTVNDLVKIIKKLGHDRYDSKRKGDGYENAGGEKVDIFALDIIIRPKSKIMEKMIEPFYSWPIKIGETPIRLDIAIIYDLSKLKKISYKHKGRKCTYGFVFKDQKNKRDALLGIIKILR